MTNLPAQIILLSSKPPERKTDWRDKREGGHTRCELSLFRYVTTKFRYVTTKFRYVTTKFRYVTAKFRYVATKFRYVTTKFRLNIRAAVANFRYISSKSSEKREIRLHSFCTVLYLPKTSTMAL